MNELIVFLSVATLMLPAAYFVLRKIFNKSTILTISLYNLILVYFGSISCYLLGVYGFKVMAWTLPLIIGLALFIYVFINRKIHKPLITALGLLNEISEGKLNIKNVRDLELGHGEIGMLIQSVQKLTFIQKQLIKEVKRSSKQLTTSSNYLNEKTSELTNGSYIQAASCEELSASIEQIASMVGENAFNAEKTKVLTDQNLDNINALFSLSEQITVSVKGISERAKVINEIVVQTNILALNAAVEAARAGDVGKGFSVVAKEIRNLAERCRNAADMINGFSENSMNLVKQSSKLFDNMLPNIQVSANMVSEISAASIEQKVGIEQINNSIHDLNSITQDNASKSEGMSGIASNLLGLSNDLMASLNFFNVESSPKKKVKIKNEKTNEKITLKEKEEEVLEVAY